MRIRPTTIRISHTSLLESINAFQVVGKLEQIEVVIMIKFRRSGNLIADSKTAISNFLLTRVACDLIGRRIRLNL